MEHLFRVLVTRSLNGLIENAEPGFKVLAKVNSTWRILRQLIALHSPNALLETGLQMCPPEKSQYSERLCC